PAPRFVSAVTSRPARALASELFAGDLARWWPLAQFHTGPDPVDCAIEPHAGGRVFERAPDGRETLGGSVVASDPPHRLAFTWIVGLSPEQEQRIEVRFTPERDG